MIKYPIHEAQINPTIQFKVLKKSRPTHSFFTMQREKKKDSSIQNDAGEEQSD